MRLTRRRLLQAAPPGIGLAVTTLRTLPGAAAALASLCAHPARAQATFQPQALPPEVLVILQAALTLAGGYEGVLDGAWGPGSRQALAQWRRGAGRGATTLAPLLEGWAAEVAAANWAAVELRRPPVSLLLPLARVQPRRGRPGLSAFADATGAFEVLVAEGSATEAEALLADTLALAPEGRRSSGGRDPTAWQSAEARLDGGRRVLARVLPLGDGRAAALSVSCTAAEQARGRLVWASFRRGPGPALLPARGSTLGDLLLP